MIDTRKIIIAVSMVITSILIILQTISNTSSEMINAANNVTNTSLPLSTLFVSNGPAFLIVMAVVLLLIVGAIKTLMEKKTFR